MVVTFALVMAGGMACYNFAADLAACEDAGRCERADAGAPPGADGGEDGGVADAGAPDGGGGDAGAPPDAGPPGCDGGFEFSGAVKIGAWTWEHPRPQGNPLNAVTGFRDSVWVGGNGGTLLRFDGCRGRQISLPTSGRVLDLAARGSDELYVVGSGGVAFIVTDGGVSPISTTNTFFTANERIDTIAESANVLLFGKDFGTQMNLHVRPTGQGGANVNGPDGGIISATAAQDAWWAISTDGHVYSSNDLIAVEPWVVRHRNAGSGLRDIWSGPLAEKWVVGEQGLVLRWRGGEANFSPVNSNSLFSIDGKLVDFRSVAGADSSLGTSLSVHALAGTHGALFHSVGDLPFTTVRGTAGAPRLNRVWVRPFEAVPTGGELGGTVWAVGGRGDIVTNLQGEFRDVLDLLSPGGTADLTDIDGEGTELYAVGGGRVLRRVGQAWVPLPSQPPGAQLNSLVMLPSTTQPRILAVGQQGAFWEFENGAWTELGYQRLDTTPVLGDPNVHVTSIASADGNTAFAVGVRTTSKEAFAARWVNGAGWTEITAGGRPPLNAVSSASAQLAYAVGDTKLVQITAAGVSEIASLPGPAHSIHASVGGAIYVGGAEFIGERTAGGTFLLATVADGGTLSAQTFYDVTGLSGAPLFVGSRGRAYSLDGGVLHEIQAGTTNDLRGVYRHMNGQVHAVGDNGTVLRMTP